jgi:hypothetical protein
LSYFVIDIFFFFGP